MKIAVLGTGAVGVALAGKLVQCGHQVMMGSRELDNQTGRSWADNNSESARHGTFAQAAAFADVIFIATVGSVVGDVLSSITSSDLDDKVLIDVTNPIDRTAGMPLTLTVSNTDSSAEQIQKTFARTRVVKTLNTVNANVMVEPSLIAGEHNIFIASNDDEAKQTAIELLEQFGWPGHRVIDLGDLTAARAMEAYLLLWARLWGKLGHTNFNVAVVSNEQ